MKIFVTAKPGAKDAKIEKISDNQFAVWVKEPPIQGKANTAIIKNLAAYFHVAVFQVRIISGATARQKIVEIDE